MAIWLSHRDLVHLVHRAFLADVDFGVYFASSRNTTRYWDLAKTEVELGYESRDDSARL
jgi:hypothetical protein